MKRELEKLVKKAVLSLQEEEKWGEFAMPEIAIDFPKDEKFGDYSTNIAMVLGKSLKSNPMEIANSLKLGFSKSLKPSFEDAFEKIEVVAPGYINFYLAPKYLQNKVEEINKLGEKFGNSDLGKGKKINIEFVSSNPTGPIHLGNARGGPLGDALGQIFEKVGYKVEREYYVNDFGNQVEMLGHSILKDPEAQYKGGYIEDLAQRADKEIKDPLAIGHWAAGVIVEEFIKPVCVKFGIKFDTWFSEKRLHNSGEVDAIIEFLKEKELAFEKDGALWFKSTKFGDDKDRVLVKSNGKKTYIATDLAYHRNKIERGFEKIINIQGPDHYKEAEVVRSFVEKVLGEKNKIYSIITQIIKVVRDGQEVKMSKRKGVYYALDDLIEEVGKDAARFIFTSYSPTSHINFDINLAKERSEKNPVYYVQYAHARICSILRKVKSQKSKVKSDINLSLLIHPKELSLLREMNKFPELLEEISESYEVHKLPHYAIKLADKFHSFYDECRVIDGGNPKLSGARLNLVNAVRIVLSETLKLIGVEAPIKM
jgi:arginyl-tRNA synthetase